MSARQSPPPLPPAPPPRAELRLFMDRAAAVVAQCGGMNARSRLLLGQLAAELGIDRAEAEPAIHMLLIGAEDFSTDNSPGRTSAGQRMPPPLPPPEPPGDAESHSGPPPVLAIDEEEVLRNFTDQAALVAAQHGGFNAKSRIAIVHLARSMGVTPRERDAAIETLRAAAQGVSIIEQERSVIPPPPPPLAGDSSVGLGPLAAPPLPPEPFTANEPPPAPARPKPQDVYRAYLHKAIDELRRPRINPRREERLIEQGVDKLGLSPPFARQLMCDAARERQVIVESMEHDAASPPPEDEATTAFLARARAIVAGQKGLTVGGQIEIAAAARELGLSDEARERALSQLQEGACVPPQEDARRQARLDAFRETLKQAIAALPRKIVTPDVIAQFVESGTDYHGLEPAEAEKLVREAAKALGVRFVSQQRAVDHMAKQIADTMADAAVLHQGDRRRLLSEASHWGLGQQDVEEIVAAQVESNRKAHLQRRQRAKMLTALGGGAAVLLLCISTGWMLSRHARANRDLAAEVEDGASPFAESAKGPAAAAPGAEAWWDVDLSLAVSRGEIELFFLRPALTSIRSPEPETRAEGYAKLLEGLPRARESRTALTVLQEIVAGAQALDPSDEAATRLRDRLLAYLPRADGAFPADRSAFQQAYTAVTLASAAATRHGAAEPRAEAMRQAFGAALEFTVDPKAPAAALRHEADAALTKRLFRLAAAATGEQLPQVRDLHDYLFASGERHLEAADLASLEAKLLATLLAADESSWQKYREPIFRVAMAEDSTLALQMVELLERSRDESLQGYLSVVLLRRIDVANEGQPPEEVALAVRKKFGADAAPAPVEEDGWQRLVRDAQERMTAGPTDAKPTQLLEDAANLSRLAAMGCALAKGELGSGLYAELKELKPVSLDRLAAAEPAPDLSTAEEAANPRTRAVGRYIDSLSRAAHPVQRIGFLKGIVENASLMREIEPQAAEVIAKYLLSPKGEEEREAIAELIPQVSRWKTVRLALADLVGDTPVKQELAQEVIGRALEVPADSLGEDWRKKSQEMLMRSVLNGEVAAPSSSTHPFDVAQQAIAVSYSYQAKAMGLAASTAEGDSPTALLRALIEPFTARLATKAGSDEDRALLARIPHELAAAEYVGDNDLRRLVALERIWLRLLAVEVSQLRADRAGDASAVVTRLAESDRGAKDVYHQLREGQAALVSMWLLRAP